VRTILDLDATRGEVDAAMRLANPIQLEVANLMLALAIGEEASRQREVRGKMAHLREQYPGIENTV